MIQLATIQLTEASSKDAVILFVADIRGIKADKYGAKLIMRREQFSGFPAGIAAPADEMIVSETPAQIKTAIDALWTAYLAALGDPT